MPAWISRPVVRVDVLYDVGVPIVLIWYWFTFFKQKLKMFQVENVGSFFMTA